MKRSSSLLGRPSPHNAGVTVFEPAGTSTETRQSKRLKTTDAPSAQAHGPQIASQSSTEARTSRPAKIRGVSRSVRIATVGAPTRTVSISQIAEERRLLAERLAAAAEMQLAAEKPKPKPVVAPRKAKPIPTALETPHPAPARWQETYDTIKRMRERIVAPVDTMGCDQAQLKETDPKNQRFATLVSLMLSSQTKDEVTDAAVAKLREAIGGTLSVDAVLQADDSAIADAICKVGFWRRKTQYIKQAAQKLRDEFDSDVPKTADELCSLPGVGPKMAFLALQVAWKLNVGIGVDVHVHRITNRLGWHKPPTKTPEETRLNLQSWLPIELHPEINHLLVGFGQTICAPMGPKCDQCELSDGLCPSAKQVVKKSSRKGKSKVIVPADPNTDARPRIEVEFEEEHKVEIHTPLAPAPSSLEETESENVE